VLLMSGRREASLHCFKWTSRRTAAHPIFPLCPFMVSCRYDSVLQCVSAKADAHLMLLRVLLAGVQVRSCRSLSIALNHELTGIGGACCVRR